MKDDFNIAISRFPNIFKYLLSFSPKEQAEFIPQEIESLSQGLSPFLIPSGPSSCTAPTILFPSLQSVATAPRSSFSPWSLINLDFINRRKTFQESSVIHDLKSF